MRLGYSDKNTSTGPGIFIEIKKVNGELINIGSCRGSPAMPSRTNRGPRTPGWKPLLYTSRKPTIALTSACESLWLYLLCSASAHLKNSFSHIWIFLSIFQIYQISLFVFLYVMTNDITPHQSYSFQKYDYGFRFIFNKWKTFSVFTEVISKISVSYAFFFSHFETFCL